MKFFLVFIIICLSVTFNIHAQKQVNIWYFGEGVGLDFNSGAPEVLTDGQIYGNPQTDDEFLYNEGCATIADSTGTLLFYTNGELVWNKNHDIMPNGEGLMGMYSSTHSSFIVPEPRSDSLFYIFTTDGIERDLEDGLRYSRVNMCLDDGLGDVIEEDKNTLLLDLVSEKLTAIKHENGEDIWLIAHEYNSDAFYSYLVTSNGIEDPVITNIGSIHQGFGYYASIGQMKASQDGNRIGLVFSNVTPAVIEVFDFNNSSGVLSNDISLTPSGNEYGIEFSPDNSKLYVSSLGGLHQFDLNAGFGTEEEVDATKTQIPMPYACIPSGLQLGPDGKIYVNRCASFLSVINFPNLLGTACDYEDEVISFGSYNSPVSFPSFMPFGEYKGGLYDCNAVVVEVSEIVSKPFSISPNPANDYLTIEMNMDLRNDFQLEIIDSSGRIVLKQTHENESRLEVSIATLSDGVYYLSLITDEKRFDFQKFIVARN